MRTLKALTVLALALVLLAPAVASAKTLAGERYVFVLGGIRDYDFYADSGIFVDLGVNIPVSDKLDITPFVSHESVEGGILFSDMELTSNTIAVKADFEVQEMSPKSSIYVGGAAGMTRNEVKQTMVFPSFSFFRPMLLLPMETKIESTDLFFQVHGGANLDLSPKAGLRPECGYFSNGEADDFFCSALLNFSASDSVSLLAEGKFYLEDFDLQFGAGLAVKF